MFITPTTMYPIFFFNDPATTEIYTLSLHDALPISRHERSRPRPNRAVTGDGRQPPVGLVPRVAEPRLQRPGRGRRPRGPPRMAARRRAPDERVARARGDEPDDRARVDPGRRLALDAAPGLARTIRANAAGPGRPDRSRPHRRPGRDPARRVPRRPRCRARSDRVPGSTRRQPHLAQRRPQPRADRDRALAPRLAIT